MRTVNEPIVRVSALPTYGVAVVDVAPVEIVPVEHPVFCLHCCKLYPFGDSVLALDGLLYCPVVGCDGSLIDQIPVVETARAQDAGKGWQRSSLSAQFGDVALATPLDLVWSRVWTPMSLDEVQQAVLEAWR